MRTPSKLNDDEWDVLNRLARVSKMDCWFELRGNEVHDWCYDAEGFVAISLKRAIRELDEGLTDYDLGALTTDQRLCYHKCLRRFGLVG